MPRPRGFDFRILIVDDEPAILETSAAVLGTKGYEVRTAADGFQALAELTRSLPDLIISDLRMPNMSGFELLSVIRRRFPHIPVIAISGEYNGIVPAGLIADAFFTKGSYPPGPTIPQDRRADRVFAAPRQYREARQGAGVGTKKRRRIFRRDLHRMLALLLYSGRPRHRGSA
jgi:CheY-like chemotaxis protein